MSMKTTRSRNGVRTKKPRRAAPSAAPNSIPPLRRSRHYAPRGSALATDQPVGDPRRDFAQGIEHEIAVVGVGMGHLEPGQVDDLVIDSNDIDIDEARAPDFLAFAPHVDFDTKDNIK